MKYSRCDEFSPRVPRPASSPPPARWRAFVCRSSGRLCISEALFRHRAAPVFVSLLTSATVAAWHPVPAAPVRGEGIDSARRHPCPENVGNPKFLPYLSASTGPASSRADPDHASSFSPRPNCQKKPPPHLINQSRSRPDRRHASFRPTPRRRIRENPVMYSSPLRVYRSFHCAPCG